ncbi:MAG: response regulator [Pseudomonadota bacterium]
MTNAAASFHDPVGGPFGPDGPGAQPPRLKCVLMDDNEIDRRAILRVARKSRFKPEFIETQSITETRAVLAGDTRPDVLLVDYRVPDGDGIAFAGEICRTAGQDTPAVIVVTGDQSDDAPIQALRAGAADFLPKHEITLDLFEGALENAMRVSARYAGMMQRSGERAEADDVDALRTLMMEHASQLKAKVLPLLSFSWNAVEHLSPLSGGHDRMREHLRHKCEVIPSLIDDLLIAGLAGRVEPRAQAVNLVAVLSDLLNAKDPATLRNAQIDLASLPRVIGDPGRLQLLLDLMITSAICECPVNRRPKLTFGAGVDRAGAPVIWLDDNGLDLAARRQQLGHSLGSADLLKGPQGDPFAWSLCQRIAQQMGGDFRVKGLPDGGVRTLVRLRGPSASLDSR